MVNAVFGPRGRVGPSGRMPPARLTPLWVTAARLKQPTLGMPKRDPGEVVSMQVPHDGFAWSPAQYTERVARLRGDPNPDAFASDA